MEVDHYLHSCLTGLMNKLQTSTNEILLCNWAMLVKICLMKNFYLLVKKWIFWIKLLNKVIFSTNKSKFFIKYLLLSIAHLHNKISISKCFNDVVCSLGATGRLFCFGSLALDTSQTEFHQTCYANSVYP